MKRIFRFLLTAAIVTGIAWWLREQTTPGLPTQEQPLLRPTSQPPTTKAPGSTSTDQLMKINGVGPVSADRLLANGIKSFTDLATADATNLARSISRSTEQIESWQEQARKLG